MEKYNYHNIVCSKAYPYQEQEEILGTRLCVYDKNSDLNNMKVLTLIERSRYDINQNLYQYKGDLTIMGKKYFKVNNEDDDPAQNDEYIVVKSVRLRENLIKSKFFELSENFSIFDSIMFTL